MHPSPLPSTPKAAENKILTRKYHIHPLASM
jgi:hypothetical protein